MRECLPPEVGNKVLPPPKGTQTEKLKSLLVDSWYDTYLGVVILVRIINGKIKKNMKIKLMSNNEEYEVDLLLWRWNARDELITLSEATNALATNPALTPDIVSPSCNRGWVTARICKFGWWSG